MLDVLEERPEVTHVIQDEFVNDGSVDVDRGELVLGPIVDLAGHLREDLGDSGRGTLNDLLVPVDHLLDELSVALDVVHEGVEGDLELVLLLDVLLALRVSALGVLLNRSKAGLLVSPGFGNLLLAPEFPLLSHFLQFPLDRVHALHNALHEDLQHCVRSRKPLADVLRPLLKRLDVALWESLLAKAVLVFENFLNQVLQLLVVPREQRHLLLEFLPQSQRDLLNERLAAVGVLESLHSNQGLLVPLFKLLVVAIEHVPLLRVVVLIRLIIVRRMVFVRVSIFILSLFAVLL